MQKILFVGVYRDRLSPVGELGYDRGILPGRRCRGGRRKGIRRFGRVGRQKRPSNIDLDYLFSLTKATSTKKPPSARTVGLQLDYHQLNDLRSSRVSATRYCQATEYRRDHPRWMYLKGPRGRFIRFLRSQVVRGFGIHTLIPASQLDERDWGISGRQ